MSQLVDFANEVNSRYTNARRPSDMNHSIFARRLGTDMNLFTILSTSTNQNDKMNALLKLTNNITNGKSIIFTMDDFAILNEYMISSVVTRPQSTSTRTRLDQDQRRILARMASPPTAPPSIPLPQIPSSPEVAARTPLTLQPPPRRQESFEEDTETYEKTVDTVVDDVKDVTKNDTKSDAKAWVKHNCYETESYIYNENFDDADSFNDTVTIKFPEKESAKPIKFKQQGNCMLKSELIGVLNSCKLEIQKLQTVGENFVVDSSRWANMTNEEILQDQERQLDNYAEQQLSLLPSHIMTIAKRLPNKIADKVGKNTVPSGRFIVRLPVSSQVYVTLGSVKRILSEKDVKTWYALPLFGGKRRRIFNVGGVYGRSLNHGQVPGFKIYKLFTQKEIQKKMDVEETDADYPISSYAFEHLTTLFGFNKLRSALSLVNIIVESLLIN